MVIGLALLGISVHAVPQNSSMPVRVAYVETSTPQNPAFYYQSVLKLALDKTKASYGDYQLSFVNEIYTVDRILHIVAAGNQADIIWASVTPEREKKLRVIPTNLLRDFNNYRLLLVKRNKAAAFRDIKNITELTQFRAGNGAHWTDSRIFEANNIPVITAVQFGNLIKMLAANRFDYISRGVHEIDNDIKMFYAFDLAIAEGIVLKYKTPVSYSFFVTKSNTALAERIEAGLLLAEEDGSFREAYENIASYKAGIDELNKIRHVIELDNTSIANKRPDKHLEILFNVPR